MEEDCSEKVTTYECHIYDANGTLTLYLRNAIIEDGVNDDRVCSLIKETNLKVKKYGYSLSFKRYSSERRDSTLVLKKNK